MNSLVIFSAFLAVGLAAPDAAVVGGHTSVSQPLSAPHLIHNPPTPKIIAAPVAAYAGPLGLGYAGHGLGLGYAGHGLGLGYAGHGLLGYGLGGHVIAKRDAAVVGGHTSVSQPLSAPHLIHNPPTPKIIAAPVAAYAGPLGLGYAGHGLGLGYAGHGLLGYGHLGGHVIAKRDAAVVGGHTSVSQPLSAPHLIHNPPTPKIIAAPVSAYAGPLGLGYAGHGLGLGYAGHGLLGYGLGGHVIAKRDAAVVGGHTSVSQPLSAPHLIHNPPTPKIIAAPVAYAGHVGLGYGGLGLGYAGHLGLGYGLGR